MTLLSKLDCRHSTIPEQFQQFRNELRFMPKISEKIACHEPTDMPTSTATSLIMIRRLLDVLGRSGRRRHSHLLNLH